MLEWSTNLIDSGGYAGIVLLMIIENVFPPLPSELVMFFAGAASRTGSLSLVLVIMFGALGSVIGLVPWYVASRWFGKERLVRFADAHARFLTFSGSDVARADSWFERHGRKTVFIGRFLPAIRTLVAIPAAVARMSAVSFALFAFLGSAVWDGLFAVLGYAVDGSSPRWERYINMGTGIIAVCIVLYYAYRVIFWKKALR